jgi:hypothetical protein
MVLFIQDFGDISLEVTKCVLYFKTRNNKDHALIEFLANIGFAIFTLQWILFRLYWSLVKSLYSAGYVSVKMYPDGPFYLPFNIMLMALYGMQVYWFSFIVILLVKIVSGAKVEDTRETEEDAAARKVAVESSKKEE